MGVQIKLVRAVADNATGAILQQLMAYPTELLVLSTHQREGLAKAEVGQVFVFFVERAEVDALKGP